MILFVLSCSGSVYAVTPAEALQKAEGGDHDAQSYLGYLYLCGKGVEKDAAKARYWYQKVVAHPGADARLVAHSQLVLGMLYRSGKGGKQCYSTALQCFLEAADQDYTEAHINIGLLFAEGLGVKKDYEKALYWWELAAEKGHPRAPRYVASLKKRMCAPGKRVAE